MCSKIQKGEYGSQRLYDDAFEHIEAMCIIKGDLVGAEGYHFLYENPDRIRKLIDIAVEETKRRKFKTLHAENTYVSMSIKSLDLFDFSNQLNIYRQNFIQTMAYFDSCMFDMIKSCMNTDFFEWLSCFDDVKVSTHKIAATGSFDVFKLKHIEATLKNCYVKDLLKILQSKNKSLFDFNGNDIYPKLKEMIARRNVHIHHNGVVDQGYLDSCNIYGASLGDYLEITKDYFDEVLSLTSQLIATIAINC